MSTFLHKAFFFIAVISAVTSDVTAASNSNYNNVDEFDQDFYGLAMADAEEAKDLHTASKGKNFLSVLS